MVRASYLPPRWLTAARATMDDDLIDAALERLCNTPSRGHDRVLRWEEMIEAILDEQHARADARKATTGVRLGDTAPRP